MCFFLAEIKCLPPEIPNGFTDRTVEYKENDILRYTCKEGFTNRPGNPKCTKFGWSINAECEGGIPQ